MCVAGGGQAPVHHPGRHRGWRGSLHLRCWECPRSDGSRLLPHCQHQSGQTSNFRFHPRAEESLLPSKTGQLCNVEIIIKWEWSNYFPLLLSPTPSISHPPVDSDCLKRSIVILLGNQLAITCFTLLNTIIFFLSCSGWERAHSWCWLCWWWWWWSLEQLQLRAGQHQQFQCSRHVLTWRVTDNYPELTLVIRNHQETHPTPTQIIKTSS